MNLKLTPLPRIDRISSKEFQDEYLRKNQPVVIKELSGNWPARKKWTWEYLENAIGNTKVPLYDSSKEDASKKVNEATTYMPFNEYLELIRREPTDLRMFLFNVFRHAPELCRDYQSPDLLPNFLNRYPMMFFGGKGSKVFLHFDIDMSHVFHTQFIGTKKTFLFSPKYDRELYRVPFSVHNLEEINLENPDFSAYPALREVEGYETVLQPGDTLFMPSGWWHFMRYLEGGFGLSQRALNASWGMRVYALYNLIIMRHTDNFLRKMLGKRWIDFKEDWAFRRA
ncbi:MAG: cupin-like domain-containing protein [Cytophagales bacterium]|nr:cupin-like domain-containing protein [Cytophagales bacterium]